MLTKPPKKWNATLILQTECLILQTTDTFNQKWCEDIRGLQKRHTADEIGYSWYDALIRPKTKSNQNFEARPHANLYSQPLVISRVLLYVWKLHMMSVNNAVFFQEQNSIHLRLYCGGRNLRCGKKKTCTDTWNGNSRAIWVNWANNTFNKKKKEEEE